MPFFSVKGCSHYPESPLKRLFGGRKDVLYSFMIQDNIDWCSIIYRIVVKLIVCVMLRKEYQKSHLPAVLITDNSDSLNRGMRMESIGKIFSHVHLKPILGYKILMLCWSDGRASNSCLTPLFMGKGQN